jgi:DNA-binding MarR family transcriptional regulator
MLISVREVGRLLCMPFTTQWPTNRLLSTAARLVEHAWNERLATLGVTHAGVMALDVLRTAGSMTQAQLAHKVRVQAQTMGKTLHRLELHGHVTRSKNVRDRRSHLVSITPEGRRVLEAATQLEDELVGDGLLTDEALRRTLADIITTLGGARWKLRVEPDGTVTDAGSPDATSAADVRETAEAVAQPDPTA